MVRTSVNRSALARTFRDFRYGFAERAAKRAFVLLQATLAVVLPVRSAYASCGCSSDPVRSFVAADVVFGGEVVSIQRPGELQLTGEEARALPFRRFQLDPTTRRMVPTPCDATPLLRRADRLRDMR